MTVIVIVNLRPEWTLVSENILYNSYIRYVNKVYRQIVGIPFKAELIRIVMNHSLWQSSVKTRLNSIQLIIVSSVSNDYCYILTKFNHRNLHQINKILTSSTVRCVLSNNLVLNTWLFLSCTWLWSSSKLLRVL